jgi:hypothetical protein
VATSEFRETLGALGIVDELMQLSFTLTQSRTNHYRITEAQNPITKIKENMHNVE